MQCDEVESACYWRRRSCTACGASGPIDGAPLSGPDEVAIESCYYECGAYFCVDTFNECARPQTRCPHFEYGVDRRVSNEMAMLRACDCKCCARMCAPCVCDECGTMPCGCEGQSDWKVRYGDGWYSTWAAQQTQRSGWRLSFDEAMGTQERPRREVSPEERLLCQRFCVGDSKKYGCRVCKPGLRLFNALSDADSQSGESEDGSGPSEQGAAQQ